MIAFHIFVSFLFSKLHFCFLFDIFTKTKKQIFSARTKPMSIHSISLDEFYFFFLFCYFVSALANQKTLYFTLVLNQNKKHKYLLINHTIQFD